MPPLLPLIEMSESEDSRAYALGRMEGKLDLLLSLQSKQQEELQTTLRTQTTAITGLDKRVTALETWRTKATAYYAASVTGIIVVWTALKFVVPFLVK